MPDQWNFEAVGDARRNAAIYFEEEAYSSSHAKLMGRHVAGETFLKALIRYGASDDFACVVRSRSAVEAFRSMVTSLRPGARVSAAPLLRTGGIENLHIADPRLAQFAWRRTRSGGQRFAISGVTHTTASPRAMDAISAMVDGPVAASDALICTSRAVKATVTALLDEKEAYLRDRLGATRFTRPMLPIIPLGVEPADFARDPAKREAWRARLGVGPDDVVVLYVGRLSAHAKANPFPMVKALALAAERTTTRVHLVQCGWFAKPWMEVAFRQLSADYGGRVNSIVLDGRDPAVRDGIWSAGDIFTLLADNIQETFGIAPLEGMAAGMPVVVSDWDGFKDTVRHGVDGFRAPTLVPPAGFAGDLANRLSAEADTYDAYAGKVAQFVQVDVEAAAQAYLRLIADPDLRRRMGEQARQRVETTFAWRLIVGAYEDLWAEQRARLAREPESARPPGAEAEPARPDPFRIFGHYATRTLAADDTVTLAPTASADLIDRLFANRIMLANQDGLIAVDQCRALFAELQASGPTTVRDLLLKVDPAQRARAFRTLLWLGKIDVFRVRDASLERRRSTLTEVNERHLA